MTIKSIFIAFILLTSSIKVYSRALDRADNANLVYSLIIERMYRESGMNGIDVTGCDPRTGRKIDLKYDFIHCVRIYGNSKNAVLNLLSIYPEGTRIRNVPIIIEFALWEPQTK